ncbi:MAG: LuxR C-terminal-related transcriptional regulator [Bacteroidales bacterium]|jgi:DNA-binding CsgD family transcriptional regulator
MLRFLIYLLFILSAALSALGIILAIRLRNRYRSEIFSSLLYYQVFINTFGFYGIWGQVFIGAFLSQYVSPGFLEKFMDIAMLPGLTFLVFAWMMLIQVAAGLSGRKNSNWFIFWFLFVNFSILALIGYTVAKSNTFRPAILIRYYFVAGNLLCSIIAAYLIHFPWKGRSLVHDHDRSIISPVIFLVMTVQCFPLVFYPAYVLAGAIFIILFFAGNDFLPAYFNYGTLLSAFTTSDSNNIPFDAFCRKFEISKRESEIIREICAGLSNKEISEKLFISLQTVKDHTHRIYIKANVRSRVQLINIVKENPSGSPDDVKVVKIS